MRINLKPKEKMTPVQLVVLIILTFSAGLAWAYFITHHARY